MLSSLLVGWLALTPAAHAAACCVGATTTLPTRLGPCERAGAGLMVDAHHGLARWGPGGALLPTSLSEQGLTATALGAWRWDRKHHVAVAVPALLTHKAVGEREAWGGGLGDVRLATVWEPVAERFTGEGLSGPPVPVFQAGLRLPTGRTWDDVDDPLGADVTGRGGVALSGGVALERQSSALPWQVSLGTEVELDGGAVRPALDVGASVGRTFGRHWSLGVAAAHREGWAQGATKWLRTASTSASVMGAWGAPGRGRIWASVGGGLPLSGLGADAPVEVGATVGLLRLF